MNTMQLAKSVGIEHRAILSLISKNITDINNLGHADNFTVKTFGRPKIVYNLNDSHIIFILMMIKSSKFAYSVASIINKVDANIIKKMVENSPIDVKEGYVYAITSGDKTKIGRSVSPQKRIASILSQNGIDKNEVDIFISEKTEFFAYTEITYFRQNKNLRLVGEWFNIDHEDAKFGLQSILCSKNHLLSIDCGCFVCIQNEEAFDVLDGLKTGENAIGSLVDSGMSLRDSIRWVGIFNDLGIIEINSDGKIK